MKKKLLLHLCCGPCGEYPVSVLRKAGFEVHGFFFNPNIHPYKEYLKRKDTAEEFAKAEGLRMIWKDSYDLEGWLRMVAFREDIRHFFCYQQRLEETARYARRGKYDFFSTTLLYSKHQNHGQIREIGESLAKRYAVPFYYQDFREGWKEGIERSRRAGLYRQQYCGCIYSERDRYQGLPGRRK
jgi:predicted adenine nucleotide alpha hydrolase (AANH) superfamily ATPase